MPGLPAIPSERGLTYAHEFQLCLEDPVRPTPGRKGARPFSIRGLGVDLNRFIALETGASLYRMTGLNMKGLPFESKDPLLGPNFTILVPGELVFQLKGNGIELDLKGGGFFLPSLTT